jgi:aquaporin Z
MGLIDGEEAKLSGAGQKLLRERLLAECVGTFFLVLTIGVSVAGGGPNAPVAIGLILGIQIYTFGSVSGGMFNPAVTLAVLLSGRGKITPPHAAAYMGAQFFWSASWCLHRFWRYGEDLLFPL